MFHFRTKNLCGLRPRTIEIRLKKCSDSGTPLIYILSKSDSLTLTYVKPSSLSSSEVIPDERSVYFQMSVTQICSFISGFLPLSQLLNVFGL
jgi:hypothetical protein